MEVPQQPDGAPLDAAAVLRILRQNGAVLTDTERHAIGAAQQVVGNHVRLMSGFVPGKSDGDVLLFTAELDRAAHVPAPDEAWVVYATGRLDVHPVAGIHRDMSRPQPIAEIGRVIADRLRRSTL